jgi:hypothetical protein
MIGLGGDIKSLYLHLSIYIVWFWIFTCGNGGPSTRVNLPS